MSHFAVFLFYTLSAFCVGAFFGYLFHIFSKPKSIKYKGIGVSKFVEIDGIEYHFVQDGKGPDLILIHGIGANLLCWRQIYKPLTKFYRVTALDLAGFGHSSKPTDANYDLDAQTERLAHFLSALEINKCSVMGCSLGGALALWLARTKPELVQKVIALAPAAHHKIIKIDTNRLWVLVHILKRLIVTPYFIKRILKRVLAKNKNLELDTIIDYYAPYHRSPSAVITFWKSFDLLRDPRLPNELASVEQPVLILHGLKDRMVKKGFIENLTQIIPNSQLIYNSDGGHHLMNDEPQFVIDETKKFLGTRDLQVVR